MNDEKLYLVTATTKTEGLVLSEVFENLEDALEFETKEVKNQLRNAYSDAMADNDTLQIGFGTLKLHTKQN